jgi:hypothetical protein
MKKYKTLVILVFLALVVPFFGWAKGRSQRSAEDSAPVQTQPEPPPRNTSIAAAGVVTTNTMSPGSLQRSGFDLQPITRPMLEMIYQSGNDIKRVPYFISDSIFLEYSKTTQNLEITGEGEVILREISVLNQININKETAGTIVAVNYDAEGRMLLAMSFDERDDAHPLIFREGDRDRTFYLLHYTINNNEKKLYYGEELYDLWLDESIPRLQIRFEEAQESRPSVKTLQGRWAMSLPREEIAIAESGMETGNP